MPDSAPESAAKPVERLYPFVVRSGILLLGRGHIARSKSRLHFVLLATDLSENSRKEMLKVFSDYPVVQRYSSEELTRHFGVCGTKVLGFAKSELAKEVYRGLKPWRLNLPPRPDRQAPDSGEVAG